MRRNSFRILVRKFVLMAVTLGINIASLTAQSSLNKSSSSLAKTFERLASGQRINHASDDAAGLAIATGLTAGNRIFVQAARNINEGVSMLNIASDALQQLSSIAARQQELAEEASNGTYSLQQRRALDSEANSLAKEFNRIPQTTAYNGITLLQNPNAVTIQAGPGTGAGITSLLGSALSQIVGTGNFLAGTSVSTVAGDHNFQTMVSGDFNGDGKTDLATASYRSLEIALGNGDGSFKAAVKYDTGEPFGSLVTGDFNGDGILDIAASAYYNADGGVAVVLGNGDGSFRLGYNAIGVTPITSRSITAGDVNGDGKLDFAVYDSFTNKVFLFLNNGNGTSFAQVSFGTAGAIALGDLNNDGKADLVQSSASGVQVFLSNGTSFGSGINYSGAPGAIGQPVLADLNHDGINDIITDSYSGKVSVLIGNGDGSFLKASTFFASGATNDFRVDDVNNDGVADIIVLGNGTSVVFGNGDGTFLKPVATAGITGNRLTTGDFNGDGVEDIVTNTYYTIKLSLAVTTTSSNEQTYNLLSQSTARDALTKLSGVASRLAQETGNIGAYQSRLSYALDFVRTLSDNYATAAGRIMNADVAAESANLVSQQIRQQAAAAVLAQANLQPELVLKLIAGT